MSLRILATFKPVEYFIPNHSYAILAEIDWQAQKILRTLKFPTSAFRDKAFMAPSIGGICVYEQRVFVAMWNFILEVDYSSFEIVNTFSHPYMTDLHGMSTDGQFLYVASTGIDAVLCFDIHSSELVWRWGPDEAILYEDRLQAQWAQDTWTSVPLIGDRRRKRLLQTARFRDGEYRHLIKSKTGYHHHHLNDVTVHEGMLYITTKQWNSTQAGAIIRFNPQTRQSDFFVPPNTFKGLHDCVWVDNCVYVTESGANRVAWREDDGKIIRRDVQPANYFVRGLCYTGQSFVVGYSTVRNSGLPAQLIEFDTSFTQQIQAMDVSSFYPSEKATAIHAIVLSPLS